jgi:hypothetical protein
VISQFSEKKLNFFFSFLSCSVHWGLEFQEAFLRETVDLLAFFPLGSAAQMGERVRAFDLDPMDGPPPPPPSLFVSSPWAAALYPLHGFLLPLDLPHTARIEKRRSTLN